MIRREVDGKTLVPGLYRHIKSGGLYTVLGLVRHHEMGVAMVIYYSHGHGSLNTRPLKGYNGPRCCDLDGFEERFECIADEAHGHPGPDLPAAELFKSDGLRKGFDLFEAVLARVDKSNRAEPHTCTNTATTLDGAPLPPCRACLKAPIARADVDRRVANALRLLDVVESRTCALENLGTLTSQDVLEMLASVRRELAPLESADVGPAPNTSAGVMDPESSLDRL